MKKFVAFVLLTITAVLFNMSAMAESLPLTTDIIIIGGNSLETEETYFRENLYETYGNNIYAEVNQIGNTFVGIIFHPNGITDAYFYVPHEFYIKGVSNNHMLSSSQLKSILTEVNIENAEYFIDNDSLNVFKLLEYSQTPEMYFYNEVKKYHADENVHVEIRLHGNSYLAVAFSNVGVHAYMYTPEISPSISILCGDSAGSPISYEYAVKLLQHGEEIQIG